MNIASAHLPRVITGVILVAVLIVALTLSGPYLFGLLFLFTLVGLWEFYAMFWPGNVYLGGRILGVILGGCILAATWHHPRLLIAVLGAAMLILACTFLFSWAKDPNHRFTEVAVLGAGLLYVPVLLMPALWLTLPEQCLLICIPAASDTVAYFTGSRFGKHKIWPNVSPKKSIEGSIAGLATSIGVSLGFGIVFGSGHIPSFVFLGLALGIMAQLGDFFESALKRSRSVKDSGKILPGHGGILDRVDSLLFVVPTYGIATSFWTFF